jgi:hypothetical protein
MSADVDRQEREIERQLAELAPHLSAPAVPDACRARVQAAVGAEARWLRARERRFVALRPWLAAAAAVALAVGLGLPGETERTGLVFNPNENPEAILADWVDALGDSGDRFARLLEVDWLAEGFDATGEDGNSGEDALDSLEESLESLERMIEA